MFDDELQEMIIGSRPTRVKQDLKLGEGWKRDWEM